MNANHYTGFGSIMIDTAINNLQTGSGPDLGARGAAGQADTLRILGDQRVAFNLSLPMETLGQSQLRNMANQHR